MGNDKKNEEKSRRQFFSSFFSGPQNTEKIKMLTADGKLVEVSKAVLDELSKKQKATNKEIYTWMNNPSKENNS